MIERPEMKIAAIVHRAARRNADQLLAESAMALRRHGYRVRGLLQTDIAPSGGMGKRMLLTDVSNGRVFPISQDLCVGSAACCVDPGGIADASVVLRDALHDKADVIVVNRFGSLEASGQGLSTEMLALMSAGIPLVTVVEERFVDAWRLFTGSASIELAPRAGLLRAWLASVGLHTTWMDTASDVADPQQMQGNERI